MNDFKATEVKDIMFLIGKTMKESLLKRPELKGSKRQVDDYIILTSQLAGSMPVKPIKRFSPFSHGPARSIRPNCPFCSSPVGKLHSIALPALGLKSPAMCSQTCFKVDLLCNVLYCFYRSLFQNLPIC
jgi:hypothetical protein